MEAIVNSPLTGPVAWIVMHDGSPQLTRRTLLKGAAGGAALLATTGGLPAWARPIARAADLRAPDSLPFPELPAGTPGMPQIEQIVVLMMENHSFDNLLGMVPHQVPGRGAVDGLRIRGGRLMDTNPGAGGRTVRAERALSPCQIPRKPRQDWNASHRSWNEGRNDGFVRASGTMAMRYWDAHDLPFTYSLVRHFPIGERFFASTLAQTYPNRRFFFTGTASGTIATNNDTFKIAAANGTIWDRFDAHGIDWGVYFDSAPSYLIVPGTFTGARARVGRQRPLPRFFADAKAGKLPAFSFIDPNYRTTSQENPQDIQLGERLIADVVGAVMASPKWASTALFVTYDEHGGYYDHVPPPAAIAPDQIAPLTQPGDAPGGYDRYGFRVPLIVVSPWARRGYSSRVVQDLTSITAFAERKWNLPAMTFRDANADPMTDYFDFTAPAFATPPKLAAKPALAPGLRRCRALGLKPPLA